MFDLRWPLVEEEVEEVEEVDEVEEVEVVEGEEEEDLRLNMRLKNDMFLFNPGVSRILVRFSKFALT